MPATQTKSKEETAMDAPVPAGIAPTAPTDLTTTNASALEKTGKNGKLGGPSEELAAGTAAPLVAAFGRIAVFADLSAVLVTISGGGVVYSTAAGGLPIDLAGVLQLAAPFSQPYLNPADVVGFIAVGTSTAGYAPGSIKMGTPTYVPAAYPFAGGASNSLRPALQLASAPAWVRLQKGGTEAADGANNETFTALLLIARGGTNDN